MAAGACPRPRVLRMRAPSTVCRCISARSASVSLPGLTSTSSDTRTLPMSCNRAAVPMARTSSEPRPTSSARPIASMATLQECVVVY